MSLVEESFEKDIGLDLRNVLKDSLVVTGLVTKEEDINRRLHIDGVGSAAGFGEGKGHAGMELMTCRKWQVDRSLNMEHCQGR